MAAQRRLQKPMSRHPQNEGQEKTVRIWGWPLPQDVRAALKGEAVTEKPYELLKEIRNFGLLLERYLAYPKEHSVPNQKAQDPKIALIVYDETRAAWNWGKAGKNELLKALIEQEKNIYQDSEEILKAQQQRDRVMMKFWERQGYKVYSVSLKVTWRLIVGLGLPSPLETGIRLHHLYGFPFLPGSAIKGVTRAFRLQEIAEELGIPRLCAWDIKEWENQVKSPTPWKLLEQLLMSPVPKDSDDEERKKLHEQQLTNRLEELKKAINNGRKFLNDRGYLSGDPKVLEIDIEELKQKYVNSFSRAFGSQEEKGEIIFFDAYPTSLTVNGEGILELDVMNPHYGEYYRGREPPADWLSPVPVFFLVVRRGTVFQVMLAQRPSRWPADNLLETVAGWVKQALKDLGIGAKTRAGYGQLDTEFVQKAHEELAKPP